MKTLVLSGLTLFGVLAPQVRAQPQTGSGADIAFGIQDPDHIESLKAFAQAHNARLFSEWHDTSGGRVKLTDLNRRAFTPRQLKHAILQGIDSAVEYGGRIHYNLDGIDLVPALDTRISAEDKPATSWNNYQLALIRGNLDWWNHTDFYRSGRRLDDKELRMVGLGYAPMDQANNELHGLRPYERIEWMRGQRRDEKARAGWLRSRPEASDSILKPFFDVVDDPKVFDLSWDFFSLNKALIHYLESGKTTCAARRVADALRKGDLKLTYDGFDHPAGPTTISLPIDVSFPDLASNVLLKGLKRLEFLEARAHQPQGENDDLHFVMKNKIVPYAEALKFRIAKEIPAASGVQALDGVLPLEASDLYLHAHEFAANPEQFVKWLALAEEGRADFSAEPAEYEALLSRARTAFAVDATGLVDTVERLPPDDALRERERAAADKTAGGAGENDE
jgi:hypothetical protein